MYLLFFLISFFGRRFFFIYPCCFIDISSQQVVVYIRYRFEILVIYLFAVPFVKVIYFILHQVSAGKAQPYFFLLHISPAYRWRPNKADVGMALIKKNIVIKLLCAARYAFEYQLPQVFYYF